MLPTVKIYWRILLTFNANITFFSGHLQFSIISLNNKVAAFVELNIKC